MAQTDGEAPTAPARRLQAELPAQALERRVERVEAGGRGREPAVLVARSFQLLETSQVKERLGEIVAVGAFTSVDLLPRSLLVGNVVAEAQVVAAERVEYPAGAPFDGRRDQRSAALRTRAS